MWLGLFALTLASPAFDAILDTPALAGGMVGAVVQRLDGAVVYARNADLRLMPASNQKLLTCAYAMHRLGPDFVFVTQIGATPEGLYVVTPAPTLTGVQLREARRVLGVADGTPVYATQRFEVGVFPSWEHDDLPFGYAPRITEFSVDRGRFDLWARGGVLEPVADEIGLRVAAIGGSGEPSVVYDPFLRLMLVSGRLPVERTRLGGFAMPDPAKAAAAMLGGPLRTGRPMPIGANQLAIESPPLRQIIADCLRPSDNHLAENLLLHATLREGPAPPNLIEYARARLREFLIDTVGCDPGDLRPFDGSGMSRHNLLTARSLATLLIWVRKQSWGDAFEAALARPGAPGTLRTRLQGSTFRGKTGSLGLVVGLSGYVTTHAGETVVMSLLINHATASSAELRRVADAFAREVEKTPSSGTNLAALWAYGRRSSAPRANARLGAPHGHWVSRPGGDRYTAPPRADRRTQPADAPADRT